MMGSLGDDAGGKEMFSNNHEPVFIELDTLENNLRDKERELRVAHSEIKALKVTEFLKDKAVGELSNELKKLEEKLRTTEKNLQNKNLEIKKLRSEKKEALAAQFAAEGALRRVHTTQKDEESAPIEAVIAPLESDIKMYRQEISILQEDKKALERHMKSKEATLVEAEKIVCSVLERALIVENVQNQNLDLKRQMEIFQEENKILEKTNRQKIVEVENLTQTICKLEESILASGAVVNVVRDYERQVSELNEEKRTLEREVARLKVSANRVATVVANEWKDDKEKVIPVKQWLEERRFLRGEIQGLRDKLAVSVRTARAEAQLQEKLRLRLKTLEEGFRQSAALPAKQVECSDQVSGDLSHTLGPKKRSTSQPRTRIAAYKMSVLQQPNSTTEAAAAARISKKTNSLKTKPVSGENLPRKNVSAASRSKFFDENGKENALGKANNSAGNVEETLQGEKEVSGEVIHSESQSKDVVEYGCQDMVSGFLYDTLQKEVLSLRKAHEEKNGVLNAKEDEIKMLQRKIDTLVKAMEAESKKMRREASAREKELLDSRPEDNKSKRQKHKCLQKGS